jgi:NAD(P)-dependent dehydrogenase (short-subunit alcohol dehydrogenase family)
LSAHQVLDAFSLVGRVAVVTGGTRGIGFASARLLGQAGAAVVVSGEDAAACEQAASELRAQGLMASSLPCDVADRAQVDALAAQVIERHGRIDVLVCNAGIAPHMGPIATASEDDYERTMTVNLRSALWLTSAVIPHMAQGGGGSVVLMSSIAGIRGNRGLGVYSLSKAGLAALARNLAVEWGPLQIRVNAISPGVVQTEFAHPLTDNDAAMQRRLALTPLRRTGTPEEIAGTVLYLASPAGAFVTGHNLIVDGGTTIGDGS